MWRIRIMVLVAVLLGVLLFGAVAVHAGWYWNAQADVGGTALRTVWTVTGDNGGGDNYHADIDIALPLGVDLDLVSEADTEDVTVTPDPELECEDDSIEAVVTYNVTGSDEATGKKVRVTVLADGEKIGKGRGRLGNDIAVEVDIPVDDPDCE